MVAKSEPTIANNNVLFTVFKLKILLRCERIFKLWKISAMDMVKNAIVMQDGYIMSNTELECCILDKGVIVREGTRLIAPATYPTVIGKNMII